ncbi:hypothetical protein R1sor_006480 [Riccia sorocarpa]|uniref:VHS domain-containing protein n=1 Tax=Riccia sorocarpa TaxID=122646 RepID=A0ABD3HQS0_9MARC
MQHSVRAVEAYRRSRLIDNVTADEDKVCPVYRLEEICTLLRNSPLDIVREMLEYTVKRLEHKSPIVKQKTLRFIKFSATKAGPEWKREVQRQAQIIRQLFHYRGTPDPLKGDALNKAVRETAHEAIAAIFGTEEKTPTVGDLGKRIQGFGSSNFDMPKEDEKKSVLSGLVGLGSSSLKQAVDTLSNYNHYSGSTGKHKLPGSYRGGQNLRRSLTSERERPSFVKDEAPYWDGGDAEADESRSGSSPTERSNSRTEHVANRASHNAGRGQTSEDRLLDSLTHPGGVRLQPTRETLQTFTTAAQKLDAVNLVSSIEAKLKAHSWQVRYKALCLLEASVRTREENKVLDSVVAMFEEDASAVVDSLQSPQTSLREKAKKVIEMLGSGLKEGSAEDSSESIRSPAGVKPAAPVNMPDLMDTNFADFDLLDDTDSLQITQEVHNVEQAGKQQQQQAVQKDLLGEADWLNEPPAALAQNSEADPFAGMSLHNSEASVQNGGDGDLFSGLDVDGGSSNRAGNGAVEGLGLDIGNNLFDGLSGTSSKEAAVLGPQDDLLKLMGNLSTENSSSNQGKDPLQQLKPPQHMMAGVQNAFQPQHVLHPGIGVPGQVPPLAAGMQPPQMMFVPGMMPMGMPGFFPQNVLLQQALSSGNMNFAVAGAFGQQQFAAGGMPLPAFGGMAQNKNINGGLSGQNYSDGFDFSGDPTARFSSVETPKEDTKAFDFISDHVSNVLGPKKSM